VTIKANIREFRVKMAEKHGKKSNDKTKAQVI
jgi:hypothetical protein